MLQNYIDTHKDEEGRVPITLTDFNEDGKTGDEVYVSIVQKAKELGYTVILEGDEVVERALGVELYDPMSLPPVYNDFNIYLVEGVPKAKYFIGDNQYLNISKDKFNSYKQLVRQKLEELFGIEDIPHQRIAAYVLGFFALLVFISLVPNNFFTINIAIIGIIVILEFRSYKVLKYIEDYVEFIEKQHHNITRGIVGQLLPKEVRTQPSELAMSYFNLLRKDPDRFMYYIDIVMADMTVGGMTTGQEGDDGVGNLEKVIDKLDEWKKENENQEGDRLVTIKLDLTGEDGLKMEVIEDTQIETEDEETKDTHEDSN